MEEGNRLMDGRRSRGKSREGGGSEVGAHLSVEGDEGVPLAVPVAEMGSRVQQEPRH